MVLSKCLWIRETEEFGQVHDVGLVDNNSTSYSLSPSEDGKCQGEHGSHSICGWRSKKSTLGDLTTSDIEQGGEEEIDFDDDELEIELPRRYVPVLPLGSGGFGSVMMAKDLAYGELVAIKRIAGPFRSAHLAKCCFREVHYLRRFKHPYVIPLRDSFILDDDLFLVTDYVANDLKGWIMMHGIMPLDAIKSILHQCLQALSYMHAWGVVHRDLKPENVLISDDAQKIQICDLGLARRMDTEMTGYLATRFYRAPEFMLTWGNYSSAVDMWSLGCILAELVTGNLLFPAMDHVTHLKMICQLVGSPSDALLQRICSPSTVQLMKMLPPSPKADFSALFGKALGTDGADLLSRLLEFDPLTRISPQEALSHPFFSGLPLHPLHRERIENVAMSKCPHSAGSKSSYHPMEDVESVGETRRLLYKELEYFKLYL